MFNKHSEHGFGYHFEGITRKTLVYGQHTVLAKFKLLKGSIVPRHAHPFEQTGYILEGRMLFWEGEKSFLVQPGDAWCFAPNVEHACDVLEDAVIIELFSPPREEFLPKEAI